MSNKKYLFEIIVFVVGAIIMIFEIVGSRILAPYLGTSIYVWSAIIGVILGSLSLGNILGGYYADKRANSTRLSLAIILSSIFIAATAVSNNFVLTKIQAEIPNIKIGAVISSIILFGPANIFLGMVFPLCSKLIINNLDHSGTTVGRLSALSTIGGIIGTFSASFLLIPTFKTNTVLFVISLILLINSFMINNYRLLVSLIIIFVIITSSQSSKLIFNNSNKDILCKANTAYNQVTIQQNNEIIEMIINGFKNSAMFPDKSNLIYEYTKYYHLIKHFNPQFENALMLGGGGYSYPKDYLIKYPDKKIDVVEIDPKITKLAKKYFQLKENPNLNIIHQDARTYLNTNQNKYDAILVDAFDYYSIPFQLTTKEFVKKEYENLSKNGLVILNIASSINGKTGKFLRAEYKTYQEIFPQVYLFPVKDNNDGNLIQNIILVALKNPNLPQLTSNNPEISQLLDNLWQKEVKLDMPTLTDNFAPVTHYANEVVLQLKNK